MFITPFGPLIYKTTLSEEFQQFLKEGAARTKEANKNIHHDQAGNLEDALAADFEDPEQFMTYFYPYAKECIEGHLHRFDVVHDKPTWNSTTSPSVEGVNFHLGSSGPWINFYRNHEFNPIHQHSGDLSVVICIDIPLEIEEERQRYFKKTNMPCRGQLEFVEGTTGYMLPGSFKVIPKTGDMYIFPATLKHCVYPYSSEVERVTMSFNLFDIQVPPTEYPELDYIKND